MPQVPYSPIPDVRPTMQGAPEVRPQVSGAAFGTNVAEAVKGVGGELGTVGNELFARGLAIQDLKNRADADTAMQQYTEAAGQRHADYNSLDGKARVDAFPQYIQDIHSLREQYRPANPMAQRYYDSDSRGQAARMIFSGAGAAGDALKKWNVDNANANVDLATKRTGDDPFDDNQFSSDQQAIRRNVEYRAQLEGFGPDDPYTKDKVANAQSRNAMLRVEIAARTQPTKAMEMFNNLKGTMTGADQLHAEVTVWGQTRSVGAANIAERIFSSGFDANGKQTDSLADMIGKGQAEAQKLMPDDPVLQRAVEQNIRTMFTRQIQTGKLDDWTTDQTIRDIIQQHPEITTEQQLRALPEAQAALDGLNFKGRGIDAPGYIHRYLQSKFAEVNEQNFYSLKALAQTNREEFLDTDFTKEQLNQRQIDQLNGIRKSLINKPDDDPRLRRALEWMRNAHGSELEALHVMSRNRQDPADYDKYAGSMLQAIEAWSANNGGKAPGFKEITEEIGPEVIRQHDVKGWFWNSQEPMFKSEVPPSFIAEIQKKFPGRSKEQIQKDYMGTLFQNMFGPTVSPDEIMKRERQGTAGVNALPEVPQSK